MQTDNNHYLKLGLLSQFWVLSSFFYKIIYHALFFSWRFRIICQAFQPFLTWNILLNTSFLMLKVLCSLKSDKFMTSWTFWIFTGNI